MNEYAHSALTYACNWLWHDRSALAVLSADCPEPSQEAACATLSGFATAYNVSRNFKIKDEEPRLAFAWDAIRATQRPKDEEEAKLRVRELVHRLSSFYGNKPWSAASKFLWIRFQSPMVIYDSLAREWMVGHHRSTCKSWDDFHDAWRHEFANRREAIQKACEGLLQLRDYLPPTCTSGGHTTVVAPAELEGAIRSEWFLERVFDHFMLNEVSYSRIDVTSRNQKSLQAGLCDTRGKQLNAVVLPG